MPETMIMLRIPAILLAVLLFCTQTALPREEEGIVAGRVLLDTDEPAVGATVQLVDTRLGASVGEDGTFSISGVPPGVYRVQVRLVGYAQEEMPEVRVADAKTVTVGITLLQDAVQFDPVEVTGSRRREASDVRPSVTSMTPREVKVLPGAAEDVLRSLQALPGVTAVNDGSAQLVVRGSGPDQNLILIDGFEVLNPYRLYGFVSMFNPETVSELSLQTGGFSAPYGDRLSAVLDVRNRDGRSDRWAAGKINASLTNANLVFEGKLPVLDQGSYLVSVRRTYYDLVLGPVLKSLKLVAGDVALPNFRDLQMRVGFAPGEGHRLTFSAFTSRDGVSLISGTERDQPDSVNVFDTSFNTLVGATWRFTPDEDVLSETRVSWYRNEGDGVFDGTFVDPAQNTGELERLDTLGLRLFRFGVDYNYAYTKTSVGQRLFWDAGDHALEAGGGIDFLATDFTRFFEVDQAFKDYLESRGLVVPTDATESVSYLRWNLYLQDRIRLGERLFVQPGLRLDVYPFLRTTATLSPRLNVSYKLDDLSTLRAAYGRFTQSPGMEKQDFRVRLSFTDASLAGVDPEQADHYVLGYDRMLTPEWQFKGETYIKTFRSLVVPEKLAGTSWSVEQVGGDPLAPSSWGAPQLVASDSLTGYPVNDAVGTSAGFELMLQKIRSAPEDRFTGWVSYALATSERDRDGVRSVFLFDQRHALNVVGNYRFADRWDVGVNFTLRSGRPFTEAIGVAPRVVVSTVNGQSVPEVQLDANGRVILDVVYEQETLSGRLNLYHMLNIRVTTYPRWWGLDWSFYLDVQNVYNRENEQQVTYYVDAAGALQRRPIYGIPIFPSLGFSLVF